MRCWIIHFFLALNASAYTSIKASEGHELQHHHDTLNNGHIENSLQRRGNKKKANSKAGKSGDDGNPPTSSAGSPRTNPFAAFVRQLESPGSQGKKTGQLISVPSSPASPKIPSTPASYQSDSPSSRYQAAQLPLTHPPRPSFTLPPGSPGSSSQTTQGRRSGSRKGTKSRGSTLLTDTQSDLARLRVSQGSGATQTSSDIEASPITPPGRSLSPPQTQAAVEKRPTSPRGNPSSSRGSPSSPRRPKSPQRQQPDTDPFIEQGVPAARGIDWFPGQKQRVDSWKKMAAVEQRINATISHVIGRTENDILLAKAARRLDRKHLKEARTAMSNGNALDQDVMSAVQKSKESTKKAQAMTFALWNSHSEAAEALSHNSQYTRGVQHFQRASRSLARQEVILQHGQAFDYKYVNQGVKEGLNNLSEKGVTPQTGHIQRAVGMRRTYKVAAEAYHKSWRDYQSVREQFSGSSSDESERSTFDDILPGRRTSQEG